MDESATPGPAELLRNRMAAALASDQLKLARQVVETSGFAGPARDILVCAVLQAIALNRRDAA
jgi:hypothetical protein